MSHMAFVLLSYGAAASVLGLLLLWLWIDTRSTRTELERLQAQGIKRRSES